MSFMYRSTAESFPFSRQVDGVGREKALGMSFGGNWGFSWNSSLLSLYTVTYMFLGQISVSPAYPPPLPHAGGPHCDTGLQ